METGPLLALLQVNVAPSQQGVHSASAQLSIQCLSQAGPTLLPSFSFVTALNHHSLQLFCVKPEAYLQILITAFHSITRQIFIEFL